MSPADPPVDVEQIFRSEIQPALLRHAESAPAGPLVAVFVGGQPGAGKSMLERLLWKQIGRSALQLDLDWFRAYHPQYRQWRAEDDRTADDRTHETARQWFDLAVDLCLDQRHSAVLSCTLGDADSAERKLRRFRDRGYHVEVVLVGVHQASSELGVVNRYLTDRAESGFGRYVPLETQRNAYDGLPGTAALIDGGELVDAAAVRRRNGAVDYRNEWRDGSWLRSERLWDALIGSRDRSYVSEADWFTATFEQLSSHPMPEPIVRDLIDITMTAADYAPIPPADDQRRPVDCAGALLQYRVTARQAIWLLRAHPAGREKIQPPSEARERAGPGTPDPD